MKTGVELITEERERQISQEGWTLEHDDLYTAGELQRAARCYTGGIVGSSPAPSDWPWLPQWWKPSDDPVRNWVKAGALFQAEKERLERFGRPSSVMEMCGEDCAAEINRLQLFTESQTQQS